MKELNLHEEIIKALALMTYDRSLTLNEQTTQKSSIYTWEDPLEPEDNKDKKKSSFTPPAIKPTYSVTGSDLGRTGMTKDDWKRYREQKQKEEKEEKYKQKKINQSCYAALHKKSSFGPRRVAQEVMTVIKYNINTKGTDEYTLVDAIKKVKSQEIYDELQYLMVKCYPQFETVISLIQWNEFSKGSTKLRPKSLGTGAVEESILNDMGLINETVAFSTFDPYSIFDKIQFSNDKHLIQMEKILSRWNKNEKYTVEIPKDFWQRSIPPFTREVLHVFLPLASILLLLVPGGQGIGGALMAMIPDIFDSAIYLLADKDPYMAGLTAVFALLAPLQSLNLGSKIMKLGPSILKKLGNKLPWKLSDEEIRFLLEFRKKSKYYLKLASEQLFKRTIKPIINTVFKSNNLAYIASFINWLIKKGFILAKNVGKIALQIGGATYTWDFIAAYLLNMECKKTLSWSEFAEALGYKGVSGYLKPLQPFTKTEQQCKEAQMRLAKQELKKQLDLIKTDPNELFKVSIQTALSTKEVLSKKDYSTWSVMTLLIQLFLNQFLKTVDSKDYSKTPSFEKKTPEGYVNFNFDPKYEYLYKPENKSKLEDLRKRYKMVPKKSNPMNIKFKWGQFGDNTTKALKIYQKQNNLSETGIADTQTLKKILSDCKSNRYGKLNNVSGYDMKKLLSDPKLVEDLKKRAYSEYVKSSKTIQTIEKEDVEDAIKRMGANKTVENYVTIEQIGDTTKAMQSIVDQLKTYGLKVDTTNINKQY